jgi:putative membrane protein
VQHDNRGLLVFLGILVAVLLIGPLLTGGMMGTGFAGPGMMGWGYVGGAPSTTNGWVWGLGMALGGLMMLAFWGAIIIGIVFLVRLVAGQFSGHSTSAPEEPLSIVRRRYAAGEIDKATYDRMRSELAAESQTPPANRV